MPTRRPPSSAADDPLRELDVRVGILEESSDRHDKLIDQLRQDSADTRATIKTLSTRFTSLETAVRSSEGRVTEAVKASEVRLEGRLDEQDARTEEIQEAAQAATAAAVAAQNISENALLEARREWPTVAKVVTTILTAVAAGLIVFAITTALHYHG